MTSGKKWQISEFEAVTDKTGLGCGENRTLLKTKQDFADDRCPSI